MFFIKMESTKILLKWLLKILMNSEKNMVVKNMYGVMIFMSWLKITVNIKWKEIQFHMIILPRDLKNLITKMKMLLIISIKMILKRKLQNKFIQCGFIQMDIVKTCWRVMFLTVLLGFISKEKNSMQQWLQQINL